MVTNIMRKDLDDMLKAPLLEEARKMEALIEEQSEEILKLREISDPVMIADNAKLKDAIIDLSEENKLLEIRIEKFDIPPAEEDDIQNTYKVILEELIALIKACRVNDRAINERIENIERFLK